MLSIEYKYIATAFIRWCIGVFLETDTVPFSSFEVSLFKFYHSHTTISRREPGPVGCQMSHMLSLQKECGSASNGAKLPPHWYLKSVLCTYSISHRWSRVANKQF